MKLGQSIVPQYITINGAEHNYNYIVADVLTSDYEDISSIDNFYNYGFLAIGLYPRFRDWKCMTREIKTLALTKASGDINGNWAVFSDSEKNILCNTILTMISPANIASTFPGGEDRFNLSVTFDKRSSSSRKSRYDIMRIYLFNKIGTANALFSFRFADEESLISLFIGGIEGTVESGGLVGLNDYLLARVGTPYELTGLAAQAYPIVDGSGDTLLDVCNKLVDIGTNGNY